jgi:hypothetical protein
MMIATTDTASSGRTDDVPHERRRTDLERIDIVTAPRLLDMLVQLNQEFDAQPSPCEFHPVAYL